MICSSVQAIPPTTEPGSRLWVGTPFGVSARNTPRYMPMLSATVSTCRRMAQMAALVEYALRAVRNVVAITPPPSRSRNSSARPSRWK